MSVSGKKMRWGFQASELQYPQTRVDSIEINLLFMMNLHSAPFSRRVHDSYFPLGLCFTNHIFRQSL